MLRAREAFVFLAVLTSPSFSNCAHRSYITVIDICIPRQLSKTTSLAQGERTSLKCKWSSEKVGSDLRFSDIHTVVLTQ